MDLMEVRRGLMMAMARGAEVIKGTFTTGEDATYTLSFGKSSQKYMYMVEMTDASKSDLVASSYTSAKMYGCYGIYPDMSINNLSPTYVGIYMSNRLRPSDSTLSNIVAAVSDIDASSITFPNSALNNGSNTLWKGYTYNYIVVFLDNI